MFVVINPIRVLAIRLWMAVAALAGIGILAYDIVRIRFDRSVAFADGLRTYLFVAANQRRLFDVLRFFQPILVTKTVLVKTYASIGTVMLTRYDDCEEVIRRESDFENVYEPIMRDICGGNNFFLGMQDTPEYTRDVANMRKAVRREDLQGRLVPFVADLAESIVAESRGRLDVAKDLTLAIQAKISADYFGVPGRSPEELCEWTTVLFWYAFYNLDMHDHLTRRAHEAAELLAAHIDLIIATRKASGDARDDVIGRCLKLQAAGVDGMDDAHIRTDVMGLLIALIPTISKATVQALAQLIDRPDARAAARLAALEGDTKGVAAHIFEAMRFDPFSPVIFRRAVTDSVIAAGTWRQRRVPKGYMVLAVNLAAMFDPVAVASPGRFVAGRPWQLYMLWGFGRRMCFGTYINTAVIPAVVAPLLRQKDLRRAEGSAGQIDGDGSPFPAHFVVEFTPA
ncbi:MAG: cytochrome P450 [Ancalomicrobiaceae bacterium]|nr:cytochrome P450 [Ancalomicrobiaceae bacterium]